MLSVFNTATSAERRISQIFEKYVVIKRATFSPETGVKYLCLSLSDIIEFWGVKYLCLSLSDIIEFWYERTGLIELIFERGNSRCVSLLFWESVPFSYS